jgi:hypothetical protein
LRSAKACCGTEVRAASCWRCVRPNTCFESGAATNLQALSTPRVVVENGSAAERCSIWTAGSNYRCTAQGSAQSYGGTDAGVATAKPAPSKSKGRRACLVHQRPSCNPLKRLCTDDHAQVGSFSSTPSLDLPHSSLCKASLCRPVLTPIAVWRSSTPF